MNSKCTIYYEDPFWVGIFEREDEGKYSAARHVFGGEPSDAELLDFARREAGRLVFSPELSAPGAGDEKSGFKRRQRLARKEVAVEGIGTFAQRALQAERERMKEVRVKKTRDERQAEEREKFLRRLAQKKEKHRGH